MLLAYSKDGRTSYEKIAEALLPCLAVKSQIQPTLS